MRSSVPGDRVGVLLNTDLGRDEGGGCGVYLHRDSGDLILFDDLGAYADMKIGGAVVHLFSRPLGHKAVGLVVYTADRGRIRVVSDTHMTGYAGEMAGTVTVSVAGASEVIAVTGTDGC